MWMFAALNTIEPPIHNLSIAKLVEGNESWGKERLPLVEERVRSRWANFPFALAMATGSSVNSAQAIC